jgi:hypothetical protein
MLVNKIDARTSLWVGLNANQSFASPVGGMIWPEANEVVREHIRRVPLDVLPPTHCGPPVVSFQLAKWGDFYPKTKIATRGSVAWFWETTEACRVAAEDVGERIMVYFDEWKNIWPTIREFCCQPIFLLIDKLKNLNLTPRLIWIAKI